jgi:NAD(P)-dependent dehydrogenase (short-subunit alcohol dehydrogenase family)
MVDDVGASTRLFPASLTRTRDSRRWRHQLHHRQTVRRRRRHRLHHRPRQAELDAPVDAIGPNAIAVKADSASNPDLDRLFDTIRDHAGRIDALYVNAGSGAMVPLGQITEEHYNDIFDRNVKSMIFTVQKALPLLAKGSAVVLTGSITGITGTPAFSVYSASKAAVRTLATAGSST